MIQFNGVLRFSSTVGGVGADYIGMRDRDTGDGAVYRYEAKAIATFDPNEQTVGGASVWALNDGGYMTSARAVYLFYTRDGGLVQAGADPDFVVLRCPLYAGLEPSVDDELPTVAYDSRSSGLLIASPALPADVSWYVTPDDRLYLLPYPAGGTVLPGLFEVVDGAGINMSGPLDLANYTWAGTPKFGFFSGLTYYSFTSSGVVVSLLATNSGDSTYYLLSTPAIDLAPTSQWARTVGIEPFDVLKTVAGTTHVFDPGTRRLTFLGDYNASPAYRSASSAENYLLFDTSGTYIALESAVDNQVYADSLASAIPGTAGAGGVETIMPWRGALFVPPTVIRPFWTGLGNAVEMLGGVDQQS